MEDEKVVTPTDDTKVTEPEVKVIDQPIKEFKLEVPRVVESTEVVEPKETKTDDKWESFNKRLDALEKENQQLKAMNEQTKKDALLSKLDQGTIDSLNQQGLNLANMNIAELENIVKVVSTVKPKSRNTHSNKADIDLDSSKADFMDMWKNRNKTR